MQNVLLEHAAGARSQQTHAWALVQLGILGIGHHGIMFMVHISDESAFGDDLPVRYLVQVLPNQVRTSQVSHSHTYKLRNASIYQIIQE